MHRLWLLMVYLSVAMLARAQNEQHSKLTDGFWLTDGYGELVEFDGRALRTYEATSSVAFLHKPASETKPAPRIRWGCFLQGIQ